jgi:hypothetical protein
MERQIITHKYYVNEIHNCEKTLEQLQSIAKWCEGEICYCKKQIYDDPFKDDYESCMSDGYWDTSELSNNARHYAYILYFRTKLKKIQKDIKYYKLLKKELINTDTEKFLQGKNK